MDLTTLPNELLPNIFKFLTLEARKNVRLACHQWNDACNHSKFVKNEKFVFRPGHDSGGMERLGKYIVGCSTIRSTFEFYGLRLCQFPSAVWKHCGHRMISLSINECYMDDETVENIILYCFNLTYLCVQTGRYLAADETFCSEGTIDRLIERKIVRRNLVSLLLSVDIPNDMYRKILQIYPCIRVLGQDYFQITEFFMPVETYRHVGGLILPSMIVKCLSTKENVYESSKMLQLKFKGFRISFHLNVLFLDVIFKFFANQTKLEKLQLVIQTGKEDTEKALFFHILKSSPKLKELHFCLSCNKGFPFTVAEFGEFLTKTSHLESLTLTFLYDYWCEINDTRPNESPSLPKTEYVRLKELQLGNGVNERISLEILSRCRSSLRYLDLCSVNDKIMCKILETHTQLRTLRIKNFRYNSCEYNDGSYSSNRNVKYSFKRLQSLEHLEIGNVPPHILRALLSEFQSSNLKYFYFELNMENANSRVEKYNLWRENSMLVLNVLSRKAPRLEILRFGMNVVSASEFLHHCKKLKNLRFLIIDDITFQDAHSPQRFQENLYDVKKLFVECPSLHWVGSRRFHCAYFYDRFSEKLKQYSRFCAFNHKHNVSNDRPRYVM